MPYELFIIALIMGCVAFMYAAVGHGGASGYLAIMALFSLSPEVLRSSALVLNVVVSAISFYHFHRHKHFDFKLFLPFIIGSVPLSFLGASISINTHLYKVILGICLLLAVLRLLGFLGKEQATIKKLPFLIGVFMGAVIGFLSGLIGIGGGIILSPIILIFGWGKMKTTAAVSALFIFCNSLSGLSGLILSGHFNPIPNLYVWVMFVALGGWLGAYSANVKISTVGLKRLLAGVLILASLKLILI